MKKLFISSLIILSLAACGSKAETTDTTVEMPSTTIETVPQKAPENCSEVALGSFTVTEEYLAMCLDAGDIVLNFPCPDGGALYMTGFEDKTIVLRVGIAPRIMPNEYTDVELMSICSWESV
jgi:hypothetical protein